MKLSSAKTPVSFGLSEFIISKHKLLKHRLLKHKLLTVYHTRRILNYKSGQIIAKSGKDVDGEYVEGKKKKKKKSVQKINCLESACSSI